jgi:hypothetical protein
MTREEKIKVAENVGGVVLTALGLGVLWLVATGAIDVAGFVASLHDLFTNGLSIPTLGP